MPTALENAISQLEEEVDSYGQGSMRQPPDRSTDWFLLRAASLGLAYLRRLRALELEGSPQASEQIYRKYLRELKDEEPQQEESLAPKEKPVKEAADARA